MKSKLFFFTFLFSFLLGLLSYSSEVQAQADVQAVPTRISFGILASPEMRFQRGTSQEIESKTIYNWGLVFRYAEILSAVVEVAQFSEKSGNGTSSLELSQKEWMAWGRWHFLGLKVDQAKVSLFAGLGGGIYENEVKTTLLGDTRTDKAGPQRAAGVSFGGDLVFGDRYKFLVGAEGRSLFSSDFDPNPMFSLMVRTGILYLF